MDVNLNLEFRLIKTKAELQLYKEKIIELSEASFGTRLDELMWDWAYIDNVNGEPIVALCFDSGKLIGHYAVIPFYLKRGSRQLKCMLSMTTMVHVDYRRYGLFVQLADLAYKEAVSQDYEIVFGFPNKNSAPGFSKKLGWTLSEVSYVAKVNYSDLIELKRLDDNEAISFDTTDASLVQWRLKKPSTQYKLLSNQLIVKTFEDSVDILYHDFDFSGLDRNSEYCVMVTNNNNLIDKKAFDYIFGFKFLGEGTLTESDFSPSLIMSDVF